MKRTILFIAIILFLFSCSKNEKTSTVKEINGIKTYSNTGKPTNPNLNLTTEKLYSINGDVADSNRSFTKFQSLNFDKNENLYLLDDKTITIKKFDNQGEFLKTFCKKGNGPGEIPFASGFTIYNDTIFAVSPRTKKIARFDLDGNFVDKIKGYGRNQYIQTTNSKLVAFKQHFNREKKGFAFDLDVFDKNFNTLQTLISDFVAFADFEKGDVDITKFIPVYATTNSNIYVAENSKEKYKINVYDEDGKLSHKITKNYRRLRFTKKELEYLNENSTSGRRRRRIQYNAKYKNAIEKIYTDNKNNLWVRKAIDSEKSKNNNLVLDIFKDGVFLNSITLNFIENTDDIFIYNDRIYHYILDENRIDVYKYSLN